MKRRIEQRTVSAGTAEVEVKTGHGGIRDVEFVVQFLQLLHGGAVPRGPARQHAHGDRPARAGRLPDRRGARDHGGHLPLPPPGRAPAPDHVRPPDAPDAPRPRGTAHPGDPHGLPAGQRLGRPDRPGAAVPGRLPGQDRARTGGSSTTCCTTPSATTTARRPTRSSTSSSTPPRAPEHDRRGARASTRSATA